LIASAFLRTTLRQPAKTAAGLRFTDSACNTFSFLFSETIPGFPQRKEVSPVGGRPNTGPILFLWNSLLRVGIQ
jgi:hypothetical protein